MGPRIDVPIHCLLRLSLEGLCSDDNSANAILINPIRDLFFCSSHSHSFLLLSIVASYFFIPSSSCSFFRILHTYPHLGHLQVCFIATVFLFCSSLPLSFLLSLLLQTNIWRISIFCNILHTYSYFWFCHSHSFPRLFIHLHSFIFTPSPPHSSDALSILQFRQTPKSKPNSCFL